MKYLIVVMLCVSIALWTAAKYGQGEENYAFEVGYLNSRINLTVAILKATLEK